jgi:hypothetical protein
MEIIKITVILAIRDGSYHIEKFSPGLYTTVPSYRNTSSWSLEFTPSQVLLDLLVRYKKDRNFSHAYILRPLREHACVERVSENIIKVSGEMYVAHAELGKL